jgi:ketosteroid isomerase-like protein
MSAMSPGEKSTIEWECGQLSLRFMALNDQQDWAAMCGLLTEDAIFARPTDPDNEISGRAEIRAAFEARPTGRITRHICTNIIIEAKSPTEASGTMYALLYTGAADNSGELGVIADDKQLIGEFYDDYVRTGEGWRIARHRGKIIFATEDVT